LVGLGIWGKRRIRISFPLRRPRVEAPRDRCLHPGILPELVGN